MNDYTEVRIDLTPCSEDMTDYLAALLADVGFESFVPDENGVTAYINAAYFNQSDVDEAIAQVPFETSASYSCKLVEGQDWNTEWEKNYFKPIVVGGECVIHSSFHTDTPKCRYDIVIDPKMAFGTGHHSTTSLIIEQLIATDLSGKSVIDMGTGTGILAILAAMRGASPVTGIEIDGFAYENAVENISLNNHTEIRLINGDASALHNVDACDIFIANINRNVITADLSEYISKIKPDGTILLSGFYQHDIPVIMEVALPLGLKEISHTTKGEDKWTCLRLMKE